MSVSSLENYVKELENENAECEEQNSFIECCEYDDLKSKVVELEKYGVINSKDRCRK